MEKKYLKHVTNVSRNYDVGAENRLMQNKNAKTVMYSKFRLLLLSISPEYFSSRMLERFSVECRK